MRISYLLKTILFTTIFASSSLTFAAEKMAKGTYKPVKGWVKTYEVSDPTANEQPEQLGSYEVYLVNADWKTMHPRERRNIKYMLKLEGILRGKVDNQTFLATHTLTDYQRSYLIRTADDQLIPLSGDPYCSTGTPMFITEQVNLVSATGEYSGLISGTLLFKGTVNNCPTLPGFGRNDLKIVPMEGEVVFE